MKKSLLNSGTYKSHIKPCPIMLCYATWTVQMSSLDQSHIYCILFSNLKCSGMRGLGLVCNYRLHPTTSTIRRMPPSISLSLSLSLSLALSLPTVSCAGSGTLQTMSPSKAGGNLRPGFGAHVDFPAGCFDGHRRPPQLVLDDELRRAWNGGGVPE